MMNVEHLAIDGARVAINADADLSRVATASGWAVVPSLGRAHPFTIYPRGHSEVLEEAARSAPSVEVGDVAEVSLKGGRLRTAEVRMPTATGGERTLTVGVWDGHSGSMSTSLIGFQPERLIEVFDTLSFSERRGGLAIDSPITPRPREPEVLTELPGLGVVEVRPAIASVLEKIPRASGLRTRHGELFRMRASSAAITLVTSSAVTALQPLDDGSADELVAAAEEMRVDWMPR
jgi:hypothetical protein